jgi:hypothetical protein
MRKRAEIRAKAKMKAAHFWRLVQYLFIVTAPYDFSTLLGEEATDKLLGLSTRMLGKGPPEISLPSW